MTKSDLGTHEYAPYAATYVNQAGELPLLEALEKNGQDFAALYNSISEEQFDSSYAEGKWTIKELLQHIIDSERVFAYRALRVARHDKANLLGFSQDDFNEHAAANSRTKSDLIAEYQSVRSATIALFRSFSDTMLMQIGKASDADVSARALGFIIVGHEAHHVNVLKERYL